MSNIEPTEEQREAVRAFVNDLSPQGWFEDRLARLLAGREAKLRDELRGEWARLVEAREVTAMKDENDTLRARVAELEGQRDRLVEESYNETCDLRSAKAREAQHLADIKALREKRLTDMREAARWGAELAFNVDVDVDDTKIAADIMEEFATFDAEDELLQRLAHYDDAK